MCVADSLGQSAPGTAASILNPALGLSLLYAQTFESSRAEYLSVAQERGLDTSEEAADRYGHHQALLQTPFEMVGTVAIGRAMKSIFKSIPRKALTSGPETYGKWLSSQIGKSVESTAGEVIITTPGQVVGESLLAESAGVRDQTTWNEKGAATLDAMSIALGQSSFMTGSSIIAAGTVKTAKGDFEVPDPLSQVPLPGQKFDPEKQAAEPLLIGEESALRFSKSKNKTPHHLAIPRESTYNSPDERFHDPAYILQAFLRGSDGSIAGQRGQYGRELASASSFLAWSRENGAVLNPTGFVEYQAGGGEHSVVFDQVSGRLFKLTKPGLFGAQAEDAGAYLERLALSNRVFGDDVQFEGIVTLLGEDAPRTVTSQSFIEGRDATAEEQRAYLQGKGFIEHEHRWVHPILGVAVWDTQTPGNVITRPDGTMQAVDLQIEPARSEELRAVRESSGLGREPVFSKTEETGVASLDTELNGQSVKRVQGYLEDIQKRWRSRLDTVVHSSVESIQDPDLREGALKEGNVEAFFNPADGLIHIIADRVSDRADAERLLRHEGIHWAFDGTLRPEYLDLLDDIRKLIPESRWNELGGLYKDHSQAALVEEYLAYEGQNNPASSAWKSFAYEVKRLLRGFFGDKVSFTDSDVLALLHKANRKLERDGARRLPRDTSSDPGISFSKIGQSRDSWDQVRIGDDFNAVKRHLPKNEDPPQVLDYRANPDDLYQSIARHLKEQPFVIDPDGKRILIANPEIRSDEDLLARAKHLAASKEDRYKRGERVFDVEKAKWIPNIWKTIEDYGAKIQHYDDVAYVRKYRNGAIHVVFIEQGKVVDQVSYEAAVVSQRALDATKGLKGATVLTKRRAE